MPPAVRVAVLVARVAVAVSVVRVAVPGHLGASVAAGDPVPRAAAAALAKAWGLAKPCVARSGVWASTEMFGLERKHQQAGAAAKAAPGTSMSRLSFSGLSHEVAFDGCERLHEALSVVMPDWRAAISSSEKTPETTVSTVRQDSDGTFSFQSWWAEKPLAGLGIAGATCAAVADLIQAYLDERPGTFGLHCGAVRIAGQLIAFTGSYRAGKSTLVTRLGAEPGCALFCDDILPIEPDGTALALGVQPRLRLPLPSEISSAFRAHVARGMTVHDDRYAFLSDPQQASFASRERLAAMVVLHRQENARARFHQLSRSDAAAFLIRQNIADPGNAETFYSLIETLTEDIVCLTLVYSDLEDATALVRDTFAATDIPALQEPLGQPLTMSDPDDAAEPADVTKMFVHAEDVVTRRIGTDVFLWHLETRHFFRLNSVGAAIWLLLETPQSGKHIVSTLQEIFPDTPAPAIDRDIATLLGQMQTRALIKPAA